MGYVHCAKVRNHMKQTVKSFLFVGIGGSVGAVLRYAVTLLTGVHGGFPIDTLLVNLIGCFCLSYFLRKSAWKVKLPKELFAAIGVGMIGSFTTFSTVAIEIVDLATTNFIHALIYFSITIFGGLLCCSLGYLLAKKSEVRT